MCSRGGTQILSNLPLRTKIASRHSPGNGVCIIVTYMNQGVQGKCITNKATPTRTTPFSKEKGAALGGTRTHNTLLTRQSALPTELPGQLSKQGSLQHNTTQDTPILRAMACYSICIARSPVQYAPKKVPTMTTVTA